MRLGLGQVLDYYDRLGTPGDVIPVLVLERRPPPTSAPGALYVSRDAGRSATSCASPMPSVRARFSHGSCPSVTTRSGASSASASRSQPRW